MSNLRLKFAVEGSDVHRDEAQPRSFPENCLLRSLARFSGDMEHLMTRCSDGSVVAVELYS